MNTEERRNYNQQYYEKNKDTIKSKLFTKVECPLCKRIINHQNQAKHRKSSYCKSRIISDTDMDKIKAELAALKLLISSKP